MSFGETSVPYPVFVLVGTMLWQIFTESILAPLKAINTNKALLIKINVSREGLLLSGIYEVLFNVIIENMIRNAICYKVKKDPTIKIKTEYQDDNLRIVFEDNGFGIEPRDEAKVFNIFFKGSPKPGGTGLEIYTAKIAVEKLNGVIRLQKALKNTIFEIILPALNK